MTDLNTPGSLLTCNHLLFWLSMKKLASLGFTLLVCVSTLKAQEKEEKPLWEVGAFAAGFQTPEYPAADQRQTNALGAPYFIYRGEVFRVGDGSAARAVALEKDWIELDLSLDAAFNADSDDNRARQGMPNLDYLFELGPQVKLRLLRDNFGRYGRGKLSLDIQARAAFSTDFSNITQRGYVFHPELNYQHQGLFGEDSSFSVSIAPIWATEKLHDYFYQVSDRFASNDRAQFDAKGGYLGTELSLGISHMITKNIRVFLFGQLNFHAGAENQDSPLFKDNTTYAAGIGFSWRLYQSKAKVWR